MKRNAKKAICITGAAIVLVAALVCYMLFGCRNGAACDDNAVDVSAVINNAINNDLNMKYAIISTEKGDMKVELYAEETPITVANFVKLADSGFYDSLTFHRVIPEFVIQGGCPDGTGAGGPGYTIQCETKAPRQYHDRGVLSMAHRGPNTGGSQFFVCHNRQNTQHLDGVHTCFGKVVEGIEVVDEIRPGDLILSIRTVNE